MNLYGSDRDRARARLSPSALAAFARHLALQSQLSKSGGLIGSGWAQFRANRASPRMPLAGGDEARAVQAQQLPMALRADGASRVPVAQFAAASAPSRLPIPVPGCARCHGPRQPPAPPPKARHSHRPTTRGPTTRISAAAAEVAGERRPNVPGTIASSANCKIEEMGRSAVGNVRRLRNSQRRQKRSVRSPVRSATRIAWQLAKLASPNSRPTNVYRANRQSAGGNLNRSRVCVELEGGSRRLYSSATQAVRLGCSVELKL